MKIFLKSLLLLSGLFFFTTQSQAACVAYDPLYAYLGLGNIVVQRDVPVGTLLATVRGPIQSSPIADCVGGGTLREYMMYYTKTPTSIYNVYQTNIPGVGISVTSGLGNVWSVPYTTDSYGDVLVVVKDPIIVSIYKTGPITSGSFQSGILARTVATGDNGTVEEYYVSSGSVTQLACSVTTPNVSVPLDPMLSSSFTGINSTKGDKSFTIGLSCNSGTRINASLSFSQNSETSNRSVIQLTGAGNSNVATGVGIQLLYGNTPLLNNNNIVLKTSSGGTEFPAGSFTARYFQTKTTVTPGAANATATLNLTYQ